MSDIERILHVQDQLLKLTAEVKKFAEAMIMVSKDLGDVERRVAELERLNGPRQPWIHGSASGQH